LFAQRAEIKPISRPERSLAEAIIDSMVRVDRTVRPTYPSWMKEVMHPKLEAKGPTEFDSDKLEQWFHDDQKVGVVTGNTIYNHLKKHDMLPSCLGLRDLEEIQKLGITHFRRNFQGKAVFGWKSVVRSDDLNLRVPYLVEDGDRIVLHWRWLGDDWSAVNPALRFAS